MLFRSQKHGTQSAKGGETKGSLKGGAGGNGQITINEIGSVLNYPEKEIILSKNENYQIEEQKITYTELNEIQTENLEVRKHKI